MHKVLTNILSLMAGNVGAQVLVLLSMPFVSRLYSPETFGLFGSLIALINIVTIVLSMRMELTIVECKEEQKTVAESSTYLFICATSVLISPIVIVGAVNFYNITFTSAFFCLWAAIGGALVQVTIACGVANGQFKLLSIANMLRVALLISAQFALFIGFGDSVLPLLISVAVSSIVSSIVLIAIKRSKAPWYFYPWTTCIEFIKENSNTPRYAGTQALVNSLSQSIPYLLLPIFAPVDIVGLYYFADKVFRLPLMLVGQPIRQVFYGYCNNDLCDISQLKKFFFALTLGCFLLSASICVLLFIFGSGLFGWAFGDAYADGGRIAAWLGIWGVGAFISFPSLALLRSFKLSDFILKIEIIWSLLKAGVLLFAGCAYSDIYIAIKSFSLVSAAFGMILFWKASSVLISSNGVLR